MNISKNNSHQLLNPSRFFGILSHRNLYIIGIVSLYACYFLYAFIYPHFLLSDSIEYINESDNILKGIFYCGKIEKPIHLDLYTKRPPLYPLLLSLLSFFSKKMILIIIFQQFIAIFNLLLLKKIVQQIVPDRNYDKCFLLLLLLSPAQFLYANFVMSEIVLQTFILLLISEYIYFVQYKKTIFIFRFQLFLIAAILIKPVFYLFVIPNIFLWLFSASAKGKSWAKSLVLIPLLFLFCYNFWNYNRTGVFQYSAIQTINLVNYNTYYFQLNQKGEVAANQWLDSVQTQASRIADYPQRQQFLTEKATDVLKENLFSYTIFHIKGVFRFFIDPGRFDFVHFFGIDNSNAPGLLYALNTGGFQAAFALLWKNGIALIISLLVIFLGNIIKLIGFILFLFRKNIALAIRIFIGLLVLYVAFMTGPLGASRFAMPLLPVMIACSCLGFSAYSKCFSTKLGNA